jgi:hypothetical protein
MVWRNKMKFNINYEVGIRLTDYGKEILKKGGLSFPEEKDGWSQWQLWYLMDVFGNYMYLSCDSWDVPFETTIDIPDRSKDS